MYVCMSYVCDYFFFLDCSQVSTSSMEKDLQHIKDKVKDRRIKISNIIIIAIIIIVY